MSTSQAALNTELIELKNQFTYVNKLQTIFHLTGPDYYKSHCNIMYTVHSKP